MSTDNDIIKMLTVDILRFIILLTNDSFICLSTIL